TIFDLNLKLQLFPTRRSSDLGRKPVKAIFRREEIFKGKHADTAPDILMEPTESYSLTHAKSAIEDADWVSGDHRAEGVIVAVGPDRKSTRLNSSHEWISYAVF